MSTASDKREARRAASRLAVAARISEAARRPVSVTPTAEESLPRPTQNGATRIVSLSRLPDPSVARRETLSVPIELLAIVRSEPERDGLGYVFYSPGLTGERGLSVVLNRSKLLVSRALSKNDTPLTTFLYGCLVAESMALRRTDSALVAALQMHLAKPLYPHGIGRTQVFCDFAMRLSLSPILENLRSLPIYGPVPSEEAFLVSTVTMEVSPSAVDAPWKRLSRRR
jgi:hypothetical protein